MDKKSLIWFSLLFIGGCYIRHWVHTGAGQFRAWNDYLGGDW